MYELARSSGCPRAAWAVLLLISLVSCAVFERGQPQVEVEFDPPLIEFLGGDGGEVRELAIRAEPSLSDDRFRLEPAKPARFSQVPEFPLPAGESVARPDGPLIVKPLETPGKIEGTKLAVYLVSLFGEEFAGDWFVVQRPHLLNEIEVTPPLVQYGGMNRVRVHWSEPFDGESFSVGPHVRELTLAFLGTKQGPYQVPLTIGPARVSSANHWTDFDVQVGTVAPIDGRPVPQFRMAVEANLGRERLNRRFGW